MVVAEQIRTYRNRCGLSQDALAKEILVSRQTISNWETGRTYPDVQSLLLMSRLFGISIDELVKGDVEDMKRTLDEKAVELRRETTLMTGLALAGVVLPVAALALAPRAGVTDRAAATFMAGILFVACCVPAMWQAMRVEHIKRDHNLKTYRQISAFMDGREVPSDEDQRPVWLNNLLKVLAGGAVGFAVAYGTYVLLDMLF